jgi:D-threo-aldose 1-dehydrogenase
VRRNASAFTRPVPAALWRDLKAERLLRDDAPTPA